MAILMLIGSMAEIEILRDPEDEELILARCDEHSISDWRVAPPGSCTWEKRYDTLNDAVEYAANHADRGDHA